MQVRKSAHGKLLLFGEHVILRGYPACGFTLPLLTTVSFTPAPKAMSSTLNPEIPQDKAHQFFELVAILTQKCCFLEAHGAWDITSTVPLQGGFGASAALCGATAKIILEAYNPTFLDIWSLANTGEQHFHGRASGIDTALALSNGWCTLYPIPNELPKINTLPTPKLCIVIGCIPRKFSTSELLARTLKESATSPKIKDLYNTLGTISAKACDLLQSLPGSLAQQLGTHANNAHAILKSINLSTPHIDTLLENSIALGAYGGKMSGAGGGGAFYVIAPDMQCAHKIKELLSSCGAEHCTVISTLNEVS